MIKKYGSSILIFLYFVVTVQLLLLGIKGDHKRFFEVVLLIASEMAIMISDKKGLSSLTFSLALTILILASAG